MSIKCPSCKAENKDGAKFCKECGDSFASLISCPSCSALVKPGKFCAACGHSFVAPEPKVGAAPAPETSPPQAQEPAAEPPIDVILKTEVQPAQPPAPAMPAPKTMPSEQDDSAGARTSIPSAGQQPGKANVKIAYMLIPVVIALALGGAYWWTSKDANTVAAPDAVVNSAVVVTEPPVIVETAPVAATPPDPEPAASAMPAPVLAVPIEPTPTPPPASERVPLTTLPATPSPKQEPAKSPATTTKPAAAVKSPVVDKPAATPRAQTQAPSAATAPASVQPQAKAEVSKPTAGAKTLDEAYYERITAECPQGYFPGMVCREKVRWQMCEGKWSPDALAGQATCKGGGGK